MNLEHTYQKKTDKQHVLDNPDTYIGSVETTETLHWVLNETRIVQKSHLYSPALFKLFDEIIVNARDQVFRSKSPVTYIDCSIKDGVITMTNDGDGIDVAMHPEYKIYIPELIFAHLRTSTNYDKTEKKIVGGKNGFGAKLVFIWSEYGIIETVDAVRGLKYTQKFSNNLTIIEPPTIAPYKKKPYTSITFKPDYARLGITLDEDMTNLFIRRLYDIAAVTDKKTKVWYNGTQIPVTTFTQYADLYIGDSPRVIESSDRWEVIVAIADEFTQVSFVNGIHTFKGGKHVEYITNQILRKLTAYIQAKKKIEVKQSTLKEYLMLFINCSIENPSFDSQTKDYLNTASSNFGSSCEISDKFIDKLAKMGLMEVAITMTQKKELLASKKQDGAKTRTIRGIPKLVDANYAGTAKSHLCTLILCEGDSAKAGVMSGLSKENRNIYGVYPMRGKLMNVRDEVMKKVNDNKEIHELKQILGLEIGKVYTAEDISIRLRYKRILFMTDQDLDGSHIKGLGINLFDTLWSSLLHQSKFIGFMNTPIIKARKGSQELLFYNEGQYEIWKKTNTVGWTVKYYKGLGTSTAEEFKRYFENVEEKIVYLEWSENSKDKLDMAFNKKRPDDRKEWLGNYSSHLFLNTDKKAISYEEFVDHELIHFSKYDCDRSIANMVDGLKISQRKTLYAAFKRNLIKEIKVAQFSGYVSEHSAYHHGEASLNGTIVGMAQNFVGSNNIHVLKPNGQFGTRLQGGKDSASERYILTQLNECTRLIFPVEDDVILTYLNDDGYLVEPNYYIPIIPMILVNGCKGIGTGFSTDIPCYNPIEIIDYLMKLIDGTIESEFMPYYRGFKGTIELIGGKYICKGVYAVKDNTVHITELPVGMWTDDYKQFLEDSIGTTVKEYVDHSTDTIVDIHVKMNAMTDLEKVLKLTTTKSINNMHLFTEKEQLKKYASVQEIIRDFYGVRLDAYKRRKECMLMALEQKLKIVSNKVKYIRAILDDTLDLRKKKMEVIVQELIAIGLDNIEGYNYLIKMTMDSVSIENVLALEKEHAQMTQKVQELKLITLEKMWLNELEILRKHLIKNK